MHVLYVGTSDIHLHTFHRPYLKWLASSGHAVDVAVEKRGDYEFEGVGNVYDVRFPRSIASREHLRTLSELRGIIESGGYDLVHCHTPIPSALTRIAARRWRKDGGVVLYTAHGFHFYRGAPLRSWLLYYPAEWVLSAYTDGVITINREDFGYVSSRMWHRDSYLIPGIGVSAERFREYSAEEKSVTRRELGFSDDDFVVLYVAEFIERKNHAFLVEAAKTLARYIPAMRLVFVGTGALEERIRELVSTARLSSRVEFMGFREDVERIAAIADVGVSSSRHEGLGLGLAEQMMCGVPVVASQDKGHAELVDEGVNGYLYPQGDMETFIDRVTSLYQQPQARIEKGQAAREKAERFGVDRALEAMARIYQGYLGGAA